MFDIEKDLRGAIRTGDIEKVRELLEKGIDVNARDSWGLSPLDWAVPLKLEILKMLLAHPGIQPDELDEKGETPLRKGVAHGDPRERRERLKAFLECKKVDPKKINKDGQSAVSVILKGMDIEMINLLLEKNIIDYSDLDPALLYRMAKSNQREDLVENLLKNKKINPLTVIEDASWVKAQHNWIDLVIRIIGADIATLEDHLERTALMLVASTADLTAVNKILEFKPDVNHVDSHGHTPLTSVLATNFRMVPFEGVVQVVARLLECKANVNSGTPPPLLRVLSARYPNKDTRIVEMILKQGPNMGVVDRFGHTALHAAVESGNEKVVDLLLKTYPFRVTDEDRSGNTPLHIAVALFSSPQYSNCREGLMEIVKRLLEEEAHWGVVVNTENTSGLSPLDLARDDEVRSLLRFGETTDKDLRRLEDSIPEEFKWSADYKNIMDSEESAAVKFMQIVDLLVENLAELKREAKTFFPSHSYQNLHQALLRIQNTHCRLPFIEEGPTASTAAPTLHG